MHTQGTEIFPSLHKIDKKNSMGLAATELLGAIQVLRNAVRAMVCQISQKKHYEGVRFTFISITRGGWVSNIQKKALSTT